jgi:nucleoside-diphosphate-sugar epimerase
MRRSRGTRRLVFASSGAVYGSTTTTRPIAEDHTPGLVGHAYAASKIAAEAAVQSHAAAYGLQTVSCRFMNTFGPGDWHTSRLVPGAVQRLIDRRPYDFGERDDGSSKLDFIHVDDMARAYLAAGAKLDDPQVNRSAINFGSASPRPIRDVAEAVSQAFDGTLRKAVFRGGRRKKPLRKSLDIGKARRLLKWSPQIDFDRGLADTVAWYRQHAEISAGAETAATIRV